MSGKGSNNVVPDTHPDLILVRKLGALVRGSGVMAELWAKFLLS